MTTPIINMLNITKTFFGVPANNNVSLSLYPGEIHALLGENGAGKSTLMNILSGIYCPDSGEIFFNEKRLTKHSPKIATNIGIGMVHQHFKLVETLTVAENLFLFAKKCGFFLNRAAMIQEIVDLSNKYRFRIEPTAKIWQLSIGEQQRVEILKLLFIGANILILDEPTSVLSPIEAEELFSSLKCMADEGKSVVFITHKLNEVMRFSDRITILRDGQSVASFLTSEADRDELVKHMLRRNCVRKVKKTTGMTHTETILQVKNVSVLNDRGHTALDDITFSIRRGEILGIAGVAGNGQRELMEMVSGLRKITNGSVLVSGMDLSNCTPKKAIRNGISYIPEDRLNVGLVTTMSVYDNTILRDYDHPSISKKGLIDHKAVRERAESFVMRRQIKCHKLNLPVGLMSGGNLQKLLIAREVNAKPKLILAAYPTHGLDVGAALDIHDILIEQRNKGVAVLLISEDLDELFELSDKISALHNGQLMGIYSTDEVECDYIGGLMLGISDKETKGAQ